MNIVIRRNFFLGQFSLELCNAEINIIDIWVAVSRIFSNHYSDGMLARRERKFVICNGIPFGYIFSRL